MPRKQDETRPWRVGGITYGFIRAGTFYIYRCFHGRRYRLSTGCRTAEAALAEYRRFEESPEGYVPRSSTGTELGAAVKEYLRYSELTLQNSAGHVDKQTGYFANLLSFKRGPNPVFASLDLFTASDIRAYMAWRTEGGIGKRKVGRAAVNRDLAALKGLMSWARLERRTSNTADQEIPLLKEDRGSNPPREIKDYEWRGTLAKLDERWRCACEVLLGAGLRYGELARLKTDDLVEGAIRVPKSKQRRGRTVPVSPRTLMSARRLLALGGVPDDEASQLDHRLRTATKKAGWRCFSAHELRHTFATVSLRNGVALRDLQEWLGHASIKTTEKYLHAAPHRLRAVSGAPL